MNCSRAFWDKRISQEVNGDALGEVWLNPEINLGSLMKFELIMLLALVYCL